MKMSFLKYVVTTLFLLGCVTSYATTASTSSVQLSSLLNSVHTMSADFVQTIYDNHGKAIQQAYGHMALERPGKFRWEVTRPVPQWVIANGATLWIYDPDLEQVTVRSLSHAGGETPALLLSHENTVLDDDFLVKELPKKSVDSRWFSLAPKKSDSMFSNVQMGFVNNQIHEMDLQDHLGHTTKVQFNHIHMNSHLPGTLFNFKPPANVDVINEIRRK